MVYETQSEWVMVYETQRMFDGRDDQMKKNQTGLHGGKVCRMSRSLSVLKILNN
jgi:hypothetical protein